MRIDKRFLKFIFVGILNTIVGYGSYIFLLLFGVNYIIANTLSTIIGVSCSYLLNKKITFNDSKTNKKTPFKFVSVYLVSYVVGTFNLALLVSHFGVDKYIAGFMNLFITTLISWFGHKYFSFKENVK